MEILVFCRTARVTECLDTMFGIAHFGKASSVVKNRIVVLGLVNAGDQGRSV